MPHPEPRPPSAETLLARKQLLAARTLPTDMGAAACIPETELFGRLATSLRVDPVDRKAASEICKNCPLLQHCAVAITDPGG